MPGHAVIFCTQKFRTGVRVRVHMHVHALSAIGELRVAISAGGLAGVHVCVPTDQCAGSFCEAQTKLMSLLKTDAGGCCPV